MDRGLRERVRWGNVARAVAVVGVVVLVVAWPRLAPDAPRVPEGRAVPVATPPPLPASPPPVVPPSERRVTRRARRAGEAGRGSRPRRRPRAGITPAPAAPGRGRDVRALRTWKPPTVAPPASGVTPPRAPGAPRAPAAPPAQGAPAPPDPDPVLREFGPEGP